MTLGSIEEASQRRLLSMLQSQVNEQRQTLIQLRHELALTRESMNQLDDKHSSEELIALLRKANERLVISALRWQQAAESATVALTCLSRDCEKSLAEETAKMRDQKKLQIKGVSDQDFAKGGMDTPATNDNPKQ